MTERGQVTVQAEGQSGRRVRTVGIVYHPEKRPTSTDLAYDIADFLKRRGVAYWSASVWDMDEHAGLLASTDLVVTLGGDGTILRAASAITQHGIPILAVNLGHLGFMAEVSPERALLELPGVLDGRGWIEERMMIQVTVERIATAAVPLERHEPFHALNELVVGRAALSRVVEVETIVNNQVLTTYRADGLIVSTPTGSTGYSFAAGGPILLPEANNFVLTPIAPYLVTPRPLVMPADVRIELRLRSDDVSVLSIDGQESVTLVEGDRITAVRSPHVTRFLRLGDANYFIRSFADRLHQRQPYAG